MTTINLSGKRLLITGAARGLGFSFAQAAVAAGASVVIADVLADRGAASANELGAQFVMLDLASPESIEACANAAAAKLGGLDGLVNNGAIATGIGGPLIDQIEIDVWDRVMTVNVRGTWQNQERAAWSTWHQIRRYGARRA